MGVIAVDVVRLDYYGMGVYGSEAAPQTDSTPVELAPLQLT